MLKQNILLLAGTIVQTSADALDIVQGHVINSRTGQSVISLADIGRIGYFRQDTLPKDFDVQLSVTASFVGNDKMYYMANGVQASPCRGRHRHRVCQDARPMGGGRLRPRHQSAAGR